jgi:hypothetical protein
VTELRLVLGDEMAATHLHTAIVAGWTGRDKAAVEEHIAELEELGVPRPSTTPIYYRVSAARVTTEDEIESTPAASGEVEPVLLRTGAGLWVGTGSDHTDREVESYGVAVSKELCAKPIAPRFWPYEEVGDHWDELILRSWVLEEDEENLYQEGTLATLLSPEELMAGAEPQLEDGSIMFCGTLAARGGIRPADAFRYQLEDPVRGRSIGARYSVRPLPLVS